MTSSRPLGATDIDRQNDNGLYQRIPPPSHLRDPKGATPPLCSRQKEEIGLTGDAGATESLPADYNDTPPHSAHV